MDDACSEIGSDFRNSHHGLGQRHLSRRRDFNKPHGQFGRTFQMLDLLKAASVASCFLAE
jgi:hypothetical protein